jgi:hypothetical protein
VGGLGTGSLAPGGVVGIDREELTDRANGPLERPFREPRAGAAQHVLHLPGALDLAPGGLDCLSQLQDLDRLRGDLERLRDDALGRVEPSLLQLDARGRDKPGDLLALFLRRDVVDQLQAGRVIRIEHQRLFGRLAGLLERAGVEVLPRLDEMQVDLRGAPLLQRQPVRAAANPARSAPPWPRRLMISYRPMTRGSSATDRLDYSPAYSAGSTSAVSGSSSSFSASFATETTLSPSSISIRRTPWVARPMVRMSPAFMRRIIPNCEISISSSSSCT